MTAPRERSAEALALGEDVIDLATLVDRPPWMRDAACREHPEVAFFVERGGDVGAARAVCRRCLVRDECLGYAVEHGEKFGIWGGTAPQERKQRRSAGEDEWGTAA